MRVRYGRWSGTQDPFPADVSADVVLDEIADDVLGGSDPQAALDRLLRRGLPGSAGLDALRRRVEEARRRELGRMGMEGPLRAVTERLAEIIERERTAVREAASAAVGRDQGDARDGAAEKAAFLDALPASAAAKIAALRDYEWTDAQAGRDFGDLVDGLRRDVAEATFGRLAGALGSTSQADLTQMRDLLAELNGLIARHQVGADVTEDFQAFKARYADLLPDADTLPELLEELARRMAAMSRLMASLDADHRAQLGELAEQLLGEADLAFHAGQLQRTLRGAFPELGWDEGVGGAGGDGGMDGSLAETVDWVEHLQSYDDLGAALEQDYPGARLEDVDEDALRRALGDEAVRDLRALREVERVLEEAGAARRSGGRLELTPRGIRRLGEASLARIYERAVSGGVGSHRTQGAGGDGELTGSTRPLAFGDPFRLDVTRTVRNALLRRASEPNRDVRARGLPPEDLGGWAGSRSGGGSPRAVRLQASDMELAEAERRVRAATVLLLDMSFSMPLRGNWVPAKRMALALHSLVASKFPEDRFYVVGFSDYARRLEPRDLLATGWERVYGTNMEHAFMVARRLLGAHQGADKQVIMVTDGEPTAHLSDGVPWFSWPPAPATLRATMAESARLARTGATLNVFLLDHDPGAARFVERMVSTYGGRIFYPDLDDLGTLVVRDFLRSRRPA